MNEIMGKMKGLMQQGGGKKGRRAMQQMMREMGGMGGPGGRMPF